MSDILIVGAGPVGMTLALALGNHHDVTILEKNNETPNDPRTLVLNTRSLLLLQQLGIDEVRTHMQPIDTVVVRKAGKSSCTFHAHQHETSQFGAVLRFTDLHSLLTQAIHKHENITLIQPCEINALSYSADAIILANKKKKKNYQAKLVVAADGSRSRIVELAGIHVTHKSYKQWAHVFQAECNNLGSNAYEVFTDTQTFILLPGKKSTTLILLDAGKRENYDHAFVQRAFSGFAEISSLKHLGTVALAHSQASTLVQPRIAIIGNAAQQLHPFAAQGLNLAFAQIQVLADLLIKNDMNMATLLRYQQQALRLAENTTCFVHFVRNVAGTACVAPALRLLNACTPLRSALVSISGGV